MTNVVFGHTTKNTETLANCVADGLKKSGAEVTLKNA
jgi:flavodoxin